MTTSSGGGVDKPCLHEYTKVIDTRSRPDKWVLKWRRRMCLGCGYRFTTLELSFKYAMELRRLQRWYEIQEQIKEGLTDAGAFGSNFTPLP